MADWDEDSHPRDDKGRFGGGGGGSSLKEYAAKKTGHEAVVAGYRTSGAAGGSATGRGKVIQDRENLSNSLSSVKHAIGTLLPKTHTLGDHVRIAKDTLAKHESGFVENKALIRSLAPKGAEVEGRVKKLDSAVGKLVRKAAEARDEGKPTKYTTVAHLQDLTGLRVVAKSVDEVKSTVENLKKHYKVVGEDNYIDNPNGSYRSHHLIVRGKDGMDREIQVRTENQHRMANWSHDTYKPRNAEQREAIKKAGASIKEYEMKMADHFWQKDNGKTPPPLPPCPPAVKAHFGCLHD